MNKIGVILTLGSFFLVNLAAHANSYGAKLLYVESEGAGCPPGSVTATMDPDASSFTVLYDRFDMRAGADISRISMECNVKIKFSKNKFNSFAVSSADFRGFAFLDSQVQGRIESKVKTGNTNFVQGATSSFALESLIGPMNTNFTLTTQRVLASTDTLACFPFKDSMVVLINTKISIKGAGGSLAGQLTVDSTDGRMAQKYSLKWMNCLGRILGGIR
jgi:hypothetical protein